MTMRKYAIRILIFALPLYASAAASTAISDSTLDDQAEGAKASASVPSTWSEPTTTVVEVTIPPVAPSTSAAPADRVLGANPLWAMPLKQFSVTRDRPIFLPSRRPPAMPAAAVTVSKAIAPPKPKEPEQPQLSLVGTISSDEDKFGIFVDQATKAVLRLRLGEDFHGWKLQSVDGRETAFQKDQQTFVVALPQPSPAQAAVTVRSEPAAAGNTGNLMPANTHFRHDR